jgi:SM-20-related protein
LPDSTLDQILQGLEHQGFALQEGLVSSSGLKTINEFFATHVESFHAAKIGPKEKKQRNESVRGDYTFWIDPLHCPEAFSDLINFLEDLRKAANQKFYFGLQQFECHLAYYPTGAYYQRHLDTFETDSSRQLSFVFYLNSDWDEAWGGELVIFDKDGKMVKKVYPKPGSFICFLSSEFPHEVRPALRERRSFTGWMHRKIIY